MKIQIINKNISTQYIVEGSTITENYNETLDSAFVRISHIPEKLNLEVLDRVILIDDVNGTGEKRFEDKYMCINSWNEKQISLDPIIYEYELNLFSETKILEGIVLPSLSITKNPGVIRSIYYYIVQYLDEYAPKIRTNKFSTQWYNKFSLADLHNGNGISLSEKFSRECPEMQWNSPTLREVLNGLMMAADCIPVMRNNVIDYIDLTEKYADIKAHELSLSSENKHLNYILRNQSSDSYASELKMSMYNVQNHNETQNSTTTCEYFTVTTDSALYADNNIFIELQHSIARIKHLYMLGFEYVVGSSGGTTENKSVEELNTMVFTFESDGTSYKLTDSGYLKNKDGTELQVEEDQTVYFWWNDEDFFWTVGADKNLLRIVDLCNFETKNGSASGLNVVYEASDFRTLPIAYSSDDVGDGWYQYQNFCLSYSRGGRRIENFQSASRGYIVFFNYSTEYNYAKLQKTLLLNGNNTTHFLRMFFKVEYETYDENVIQFSKDQSLLKNQRIVLDNQSESYIDNFKVGNLEQLKANRIGNPQVMINARFENDYENLYKIGDYFEDNIVYKTQYQIYENHIEVNLYAMKDYVLKDYFTGVNARSRSWKIVSGSDALTRHELTKFYCALDFRDYFTGLELDNYIIDAYASAAANWVKVSPNTKYIIENYANQDLEEYDYYSGNLIKTTHIENGKEEIITSENTEYVKLPPYNENTRIRFYAASQLDFNLARYFFSPLLDLYDCKPIKHIAVQYISGNQIFPVKDAQDNYDIVPQLSEVGLVGTTWSVPQKEIYFIYDVISRISGNSLTFTYGNNDNYQVFRKPILSQTYLTLANPSGVYIKSTANVTGYLGNTSYQGIRNKLVYYADENGENFQQNIVFLDDYNNLCYCYEKIEDLENKDVDIYRTQLFYAFQFQMMKGYARGFGENRANPSSYVKGNFTINHAKDNKEILRNSIQFEFLSMSENISIGPAFISLQKSIRKKEQYEPAENGELDIVVEPSDFIQLGGPQTVNVTVRPPYVAIAGEGVYYKGYEIYIPSLAGKTLASCTISSDVTGYNNTVAFDNNYTYIDPITHQTVTTARFYGTIYTTNGSASKTAIITYTTSDAQTAYFVAGITTPVEQLFNSEVQIISLSPSSDVAGFTNSAIFSSGTFICTLFRSTRPLSSVNYKIIYKIKKWSGIVTNLRFYEGGTYYNGIKTLPLDVVRSYAYSIIDGGEKIIDEFDSPDCVKSKYAVRIEKKFGDIRLPLFITDSDDNIVLAINETTPTNNHPNKIDLYLSIFNSNDIFIYDNVGKKSTPDGYGYINTEDL